MTKRFEFTMLPGRRASDSSQVRYEVVELLEVPGHQGPVAGKQVCVGFGYDFEARNAFESVVRGAFPDFSAAAAPENPAAPAEREVAF